LDDRIVTDRLWHDRARLLTRPRRIVSKLMQFVARKVPLPPFLRVTIQRWRGVRFEAPDTVFIGENVYFDDAHPEYVRVGPNVVITEGAFVLSHFYSSAHADHAFRHGEVSIEEGVFIGANAVIAAPVTIGRGAIVAANSTVTADVAAGDIVAGVPARPIGRRGDLPVEQPDQ
jgi:acetyltransferase-like isoleucine patch superfamily enzyme